MANRAMDVPQELRVQGRSGQERILLQVERIPSSSFHSVARRGIGEA